MASKSFQSPALPSSSTPTCTNTNAEEDDTVQVVVPDKRRVLSDIKAMVDYQETQIQMAQREAQQARNQLAVERNRVSELEAENEELKNNLEEAEQSLITMQQEKTENEGQMYLLKTQVQSLQNQQREGQKQTTGLLNITKGHANHVRTFLKNFNETEKDLITLFPGYESSSPVSVSGAAIASSREIVASSSVNSSENVRGRLKTSRPVSMMTSSHRHQHKRLKTKSRSRIMAKNGSRSRNTNVEAVAVPSSSDSEDSEYSEDSEDEIQELTLIQLEKDTGIALRLGDDQRVLDLTTKAMRLTQDNSMYRILKVHALTNLGHIQEAQDESTKILQIENIMEEMNAFALCTMAYCFYQADKTDTCLEYYRQALVKEPGNETATKYLPKIKAIHDLRATTHRDGREAVEVYKKCLELIRSVDGRGNRVIESKLLYLCAVHSTDNRATAMEFVNQAIANTPKFAKALFQRAKLFVMDKKYEEALKDCQEVLRLDPKLYGVQSLIDACHRVTVQTPSTIAPARASE